MPLPETMDWQPIETAPRDGTVIPCCWAGGRDWLPMCWKHNPRADKSYFGDVEEYDDYELIENQPTHWFPLPPAPPSPEPMARSAEFARR